MTAALRYLNRTDKTGFLTNIILAVVATCLLNGVIFGLGWDSANSTNLNPSFAPPGYVIGIVWVILFAFMSAARWVTLRLSAKPLVQHITLLLIFCWAYPLYTGGLRYPAVGLAGNVLTLLYTLYVLTKAWPTSKPAFWLLAPLAIWLIFATILTLAIVTG